MRSSRAHRIKKICLPAGLLVGEVGPFAGDRAAGAMVGAGCLEGQEICEVKKASVALPALGQMTLSATSVFGICISGDMVLPTEASDLVARCRAFLGLCDGAVIHPDDGVPTILAGGGDGDGPILGIEGD